MATDMQDMHCRLHVACQYSVKYALDDMLSHGVLIDICCLPFVLAEFISDASRHLVVC